LQNGPNQYDIQTLRQKKNTGLKATMGGTGRRWKKGGKASVSQPSREQIPASRQQKTPLGFSNFKKILA